MGGPMINSMTGFGRSEMEDAGCKVIAEIRTVNHRYCDINIKMPKKLSFLESNVRNSLKQYLQRGKIDVFISYEDYTEGNVHVKYNEDIARTYMEYLRQMGETFSISNEVNTVALSRFPDVFTLEDQAPNEESLWRLLEHVLEEAAQACVDARVKEGAALTADLTEKLGGMIEMVDYIETFSGGQIEEYREKLTQKVSELLAGTPVDEGRIATEVVIYADKICVDEETVRLKSHIQNMLDILETGGSVGRKLDFIAQEMNREANTILSKANALDISNKAIDLKTEIEKVREQIQNIE